MANMASAQSAPARAKNAVGITQACARNAHRDQARAQGNRRRRQSRRTTVLQRDDSVLDSIADKNIVHRNKASRNKSRLSAAIKALP